MTTPKLHSLDISARGIFVENPGKAELAGVGEEFLESAEVHWLPGPTSRARPYARNGSILAMERDETIVSGLVSGSDYDYEIRVHGVTESGPFQPSADCTCPYGAMHGDWCKHAIALAYAIAALLDGHVSDELSEITSSATANEAARTHLETIAQAWLAAPPLNVPAPDSVEPDGTFDPDSAFAEANRWLPFPFHMLT